MTLTTDELDRLSSERAAPPPETDAGEGPGPAGGTPLDQPAGQGQRASFVVAASALATMGAAWMVTSLFRGGLTPKAIALVGVALGAALSWISASRGQSWAQWAVAPAAAAIGAVLVAPAATGGTANLPGLVAEALRAGGLLQPPVPFEPGWRFLFVVLFAVVSSAAVGLATMTGRSRLAVAVPVPVTIAAALLQPEGKELVPAAVSGLLTIAALALAFGADTPTGGTSPTRQFEARRLGRAALLLGGLLLALIVISRAGFLFPTPDRDEVIPPQRPPTPPAEPDRVLFTVDSPRTVPLRVGVLDEYDGEAFLLPPVDPERLIDVEDAGLGSQAAETFQVEVEIADVRGATLPAPGSATTFEGGGEVEYDPRTGVFRLATGRAPKGYSYSVEAAVPPDGRALAEAAPPANDIVDAFTAVPPPPNEVVVLLAEAPANPFDRLQFVRQALYNSVVAAGAGSPVEVSPARVGEMLRPGAEATPYEITAAEVLLARWAGIPARLGFGFYGGEEVDGLREFRPRHGAAWLEAHFGDLGWVPLVGTPPRAKASVSENEKNEDPAVLATQDLALVVYVPVQLETIELLYQRLRYWASIIVPLLAALGLAMAAWPYPAKRLRSWQRRRWAMGTGIEARILSAYAEFRDRAYDLNVGDQRAAPLEFLGHVTPDLEHEELAWLVTRALWGDLRRDLKADDAEAAEEMALSVARRLAGAQTAVNRVLAGIARASLRSPYTYDIPNLWFGSEAAEPAPVSAPRPTRVARLRHALVSPRLAFGVITLAVVVGVVALAPTGGSASAELPLVLPDPLVPETAAGFAISREDGLEENYAKPGDDALVTDGRVFTVRQGTVVAGSLQVAVLRADIDGRDRDVQRGLERVIQTGEFRTHRFGTFRVRKLEQAEQTIYVYFPPTANVMEVFVLRADTEGADELVREVISHQLDLPSPRRGRL